MSPQQRKILYIAGTGRTGSTLLGQCLSCSDQTLFAGEITHLWKRGFNQDELCGCGSPVSLCGFWREVAKRLTLQGRASRHRLVKLRDQVCQFRRLPHVALGRPLNTTHDQTYCETYQQLVETLIAISGRQNIVDSSKYPSDLAVLASGGLPVTVIHLVRDCRGVVYAWKKRKLRTEIHWKQQLMPRYGTLQTAVAWRVFNQLIPKIARQYNLPYQLLRYERFVTGFPHSLRELQAEIGLPVAVECDWQRANVHHVAANPSRFQFDPTHMHLDEEWKSRISSFDRWIIRLVCGRQQRQFGY